MERSNKKYWIKKVQSGNNPHTKKPFKHSGMAFSDEIAQHMNPYEQTTLTKLKDQNL